nr:hypothetical protein [Halobellus sp. Atlit-38R]
MSGHSVICVGPGNDGELGIVVSTIVLKQLEVLGILELKEGGPGGAIQPVVPFDKIEMHIDYPLLDDVDVDSTPASAD